MTDPDDGFETTHIVYMGRRLSTKGKLLQLFALLADLQDGKDEADPEFNAMLYDRAMRGPEIGAVYEVPMNQAGTARFGDARRVEGYSDRPAVDRWRIVDMTQAREKERRNAERRLAKASTDIGDMTLDQLRTMIASQPQHVADGTLLIVIRHLTGRR